VARPAKGQKEAAARTEDKVDAAAKASIPASACATLIPGAGLFVAAGIALVGGGLSFWARKLHKLGVDPPRDDFDQETIIGPPVLRPRVLGGTSVEEAAVEFVRTEDELARILEAMITAIERASGAELENRTAMAEARTAEVLTFADMLSSRLVESGGATDALRQALQEYAGPIEFPDSPGQLNLFLGEDITAQLEEMGVDRQDLVAMIKIIPDDPIGYLDTTLADASEADREFGLGLKAALLEETLLEPEAGMDAGSTM